MVASSHQWFFESFLYSLSTSSSHVEQPIRKESRIFKATWKKEKKK
jgi:hypothetical protein